MQLALSGIWTRNFVSISYDDNHYTTGTSIKTFLFQVIQFSHTVLIQTIPFSISTVFVFEQLNLKKSSSSNNLV